jgi:hypothetical protein
MGKQSREVKKIFNFRENYHPSCGCGINTEILTGQICLFTTFQKLLPCPYTT